MTRLELDFQPQMEDTWVGCPAMHRMSMVVDWDPGKIRWLLERPTCPDSQVSWERIQDS